MIRAVYGHPVESEARENQKSDSSRLIRQGVKRIIELSAPTYMITGDVWGERPLDDQKESYISNSILDISA